MLQRENPSPVANPEFLDERPPAWFQADLNLQCPLLEALPFPAGVSDSLIRVQRLVMVAMESTATFDARAQAFVVLKLELESSGVAEAESLRIRQILFSQMNRIDESSQLTLAGIEINLEQTGYKLVTTDTSSDLACPPRVRRIGSAEDTHALSPHTIQLCEEMLTLFAGKSERLLRQSGPGECLACITILILYLQRPQTSWRGLYQGHEAKFPFIAIHSLWHLLLKSIPKGAKKKMPAFSQQYDLPAMQTVMHRIGHHVVQDWGESTGTSLGNSPANHQKSSAVHAIETTHVVVPGEITPASDDDARVIIKRLGNLRTPLKLIPLPSAALLEAIQSKLLTEFPWASEAVALIMGELITRRLFGVAHMVFSPVLLIGPPGVGKTRLVRRVAEELAAPHLAINFAGMDDSRSLLGTARGWGTAQPAPLIEFLSAQNSASALMLLDEIDKVAPHSAKTSSPTNGLLSFLEPENARNFFDAFLQTRVDLSKVSFVATANSTKEIPGSVLSRMRLCIVGRPSMAQLAATTQFAAEDVAKDWGVNPALFPPISLFDLDAAPRNMRHLKLLVKSYLVRWAATHLQNTRLH